MSKYWELLKDPRWQRRRLDVLNRADFTCEECGDKETTLHVHHMYYERGAKPWEYSDEALRVLCEKCHEIVAETQQVLARAVARLTTRQIDLTIGFVRGQILLNGVGVPVGNTVQKLSLAMFFDTTVDDIDRRTSKDGWLAATTIPLKHKKAAPQ